MKFTIFVVLIAVFVFVGYLSINWAIEKINYEPVVLEDVKIPSTNLYPTGMMYLADEQIQGYGIKNFGYQLQSLDFDELKNLQVSLLVIDPENGSGDLQFTKEQLSQIKKNKKYVIAYIDIGEAENWRSYYKDLPKDILGSENPNWADCYYVAFWQPYWQNLTYDRINRYLDQGYDGVYLDMIDVYEYWQSNGVRDTKQSVINFIEDISVRIKGRNQNFLVIPNNALKLLKEQDYINYIDGVGAESTFFNDDQKSSWREWDLEYLRYAVSKGKFVLSIDYSEKLNNRCNFVNLAKANKFVPFVGPKDLDQFVHFSCPEIGYSQ